MGIVGRPVHFVVGEAPVGPPIGGGGIISPYLVYDTFTDTAGTVLNLHTPDVDVVGGGWNRDLNTMIINASNQVEEDINSSVSISTIDAGESDVVVTADCWQYRLSADRANAGIVFRFSDTNNFWALILSSSTPAPWEWTLQKMVAGLASYPWTKAGTDLTGSIDSAVHEFRVTLSGDTIRCEIPAEGIDETVFDSHNSTATRYGFRMYNVSSPATVAYADNFTITDNTAQATLVGDSFTDAEGTLLVNHTPDIDAVGTGWDQNFGSLIKTYGNKASAASHITGAWTNLIDVGENDVIVSGDFDFGTGSSGCGLWLRQNNVNEGWALFVSNPTTSDPDLHIYQWSGSYTSRASTSLTGEGPLNGRSASMVFEANGSSLDGAIYIGSNKYVVSYTSTSYSSNTYCGMRLQQAGVDTDMDNFLVTTLA